MRDLYVLRVPRTNDSDCYLVGFPPNVRRTGSPEQATAYASLELAEKMIPWMPEPCYAARRPPTSADQFREVLTDYLSDPAGVSGLVSEFDRLFPLEVVEELPSPFNAPLFQVIVGNVGTVYAGASFTSAVSTYNHYVQYSRSSGSRVTGQPVTMMRAGEIDRDYHPEPEEEEDGGGSPLGTSHCGG